MSCHTRKIRFNLPKRNVMHRNPESYDSISIHFENLMKAERDMIWYLYKLLFEGKVAETKITEGPEF